MPYQVRSRIFVAKTKNTTDCLIAGTARAIARPKKQICKDEFTLYWVQILISAGHRHLRRRCCPVGRRRSSLAQATLATQEVAFGSDSPWTKDRARLTADALDALGRTEETKALRKRYRVASSDEPKSS